MTGTEIAAVILGGMSAALGLAAFAVWAHAQMRTAGRRVDRLADPARCPDCGQPFEAHDDVITIHDCDREAGF